jgi:hypothetical protein
MASRSKKGTQIYFPFYQKSWQMNPFQVHQQGSYEYTDLSTGHFAYLSKTSSIGFPSKGALPQGSLHGTPRREVPHHLSPPSFIYQSPQYTRPPTYQVPLNGKGPPWREMPISETFLTYLPGSPVKELPLKPPLRSLFREVDASSTVAPSSIAQSPQ